MSLKGALKDDYSEARPGGSGHGEAVPWSKRTKRRPEVPGPLRQFIKQEHQAVVSGAVSVDANFQGLPRIQDAKLAELIRRAKFQEAEEPQICRDRSERSPKDFERSQLEAQGQFQIRNGYEDSLPPGGTQVTFSSEDGMEIGHNQYEQDPSQGSVDEFGHFDPSGWPSDASLSFVSPGPSDSLLLLDYDPFGSLPPSSTDYAQMSLEEFTEKFFQETSGVPEKDNR